MTGLPMRKWFASTCDNESRDIGPVLPWWVLGWLIALLAVSIIVRVTDPVGWLGSDDASYHAAAEHVLHGEPIHRVHHHMARAPIVLAVAGAVWLFGESPWAMAVPMFVASILCVGLVAVLGRLLWGWWEGLCAATVLSFIPVYEVASTSVLPGAYVCLWVTAAFLFACLGVRTPHGGRGLIYAVGSGVAIGLATSTKLFAAPTVLGVLVIAWTQMRGSRRRRLAWVGCVAAGIVTYFALEAAFYAHMTGDAAYAFRAVRSSTAVHAAWVGEASVYGSVADTVRLIGRRLSMPFRPVQSGWGVIGMAFWPAILAALVFDRRGRALGFWAIATYFGAAFFPIGFTNGLHVMPEFSFNGTNLSVLCVPFVLCLGWALRRSAGSFLRPEIIRRSWPPVLAVVVLVSSIDDASFRRTAGIQQQDIARAVGRLVTVTTWDDERPIFMAPSLYWRYRILFPEDLRARLRVAVDPNAPPWWRDATMDIANREAPLPPPEQAYLIVTPTQLAGQSHFWDYGVMLPRDGLAPWRSIKPIASLRRFRDGTVDTQRTDVDHRDDGKEVLLLLGGEAGLALRNGSDITATSH